ncbi:MAG: DUF5615 family PIN-like protein [Bryobacterales bacterium]|nr:DUF5615 family PIN-like protein [Acidobacteriota bacterium]MCB9385435.1 DUF5615 family PIN-like protein [Bryobacterales bacterium]
MKGLLLDQGLPRSTAGLLRACGVNAIHVGECGLAHASDKTILEYADREGFAIVTLDADFHLLLATSGADSPSAIRLRVQGMKGPEACELILSVVARAATELKSGVLISANRTLLRIKRLPIQTQG